MAKNQLRQFPSHDYSIPSSDRVSQLFIRQYGAEKAKIHFILVHGALEHSGRHMDLVEFLLKNFGHDVTVTVYDHLGHGRSGGIRAWIQSFQNYVDDLGVVGEFVQKCNDAQTKTVMLAHSLGGLISLTRILDPAYGWNHPLHAIVFSSPCVRPKMVLGSYSEILLEKMARLSTKIHLPMIYKGSDLTRDPERANDFQIDTLIPRFITVGMAKGIIEASHKVRGYSYYLRTPSLFLVAGDDRIVDAESTMIFAHGIDKRLTQVIHYPEHRHELWNEVDRLEIFETMKKWIEKTLKEIP
jgi:acylglycerol lipase